MHERERERERERGRKKEKKGERVFLEGNKRMKEMTHAIGGLSFLRVI